MSGRLRVYELARELGLSSTEMIEVLQAEGVTVKSHASNIDEELAEIIRENLISKRIARKAEAAIEIAAVAEESKKLESAGSSVDDEDESEDDEDSGDEIHLKPPVIVRDLADALRIKPNELITQLMMMNVFAAINQVIDKDIVEKVCTAYGRQYVPEKRTKVKAKAVSQQLEAKREAAVKSTKNDSHSRPPVVAFLGHVDHGKTSLQDAVRNTSVTEDEAGGITQHIGASTVDYNGQLITFLDTPGHEAFTAMRARGANATDIAVIVVAADDGIMPQSIEAINHARAAGVPIIIAMNKMDLPGADPEKVKIGLQRCEVTTEDWGGDVGLIPVSAIAKTGLDDLIERILLEAEMLELKCNPDLPCEAMIIEAQLEGGSGPTANILIQNGSIHVGDAILCGQFYGRVKALINDKGERIKCAGPSCPVKVLGLSGVPEAGEKLVGCKNEKVARQMAEERAIEIRQGSLQVERMTSLDDLFGRMESEDVIELSLILKTDVQGSIEAIRDSLNKISSEKIRLKIIHSAVGEISENDVILANASNAMLVGFHVRVTPSVNRLAKNKGVEIRLYTIIYELLQDIEDAMRGKLDPDIRENKIGRAEILKIFENSKVGKICGCAVREGIIKIKSGAKVYRENELIYKGTIRSLQHHKDQVREMRSGMECGIGLDNFEEFEEGDIVECFEIEKTAAEL